MTEENKELLNQRRDKRKRVQRMKMFIVSFIAGWMVLSILVMTILCIKVISLQRQINNITGGTVVTNEVTESDNDYNSDYVYVASTGTMESNLAEEGDILKVYLTFDDGPSSNTDAILDILDDYGVKATFFVTGKADEESKARYKRIVDEGHTIGMHSYSHQYSNLYSSPEAFKADFSKIQNLIYDATGVESTIYRFPGGSSNKVSNADMTEFIKYVDEMGVSYFDWNVSCGDATSQAYSADELVENVMRDVVKYKTSVVLLHDADTKSTTVQALPKMIESLQEVGALILPISEDTTLIQHVTLQTESQ